MVHSDHLRHCCGFFMGSGAATARDPSPWMPTRSRSGGSPDRAFGLSGWRARTRGRDLGGPAGLGAPNTSFRAYLHPVSLSAEAAARPRDGINRIGLCASESAVIGRHGPDAPSGWSACNIPGGKFRCFQDSKRRSFAFSSRTCCSASSRACRSASSRCSASSRACRSANRP